MDEIEELTRRRRRAKNIQGAIWLIGIGILWLTDGWWPGILVLVGLSIVVGALLRRGAPEMMGIPDALEAPNAAMEDAPMPAPAEPVPAAAPESIIEVEPIPAPSPVPSPEFGWDWLPTNCPRCGAPLTSQTIKRLNNVTAQCAYCGSAMKKGN